MHTTGPAVVDELIHHDLPNRFLPEDEEVQTWLRSIIPRAIDTLFERFQHFDHSTVDPPTSPVHVRPTDRNTESHTFNQDDSPPFNRQDSIPESRNETQGGGVDYRIEPESSPRLLHFDELFSGLFDLDDHTGFFPAFMGHDGTHLG